MLYRSIRFACIVMLIIPCLSSFSNEYDDLLHSANLFLESLTPDQQLKANRSFDDDERRNWHFIPKVRIGLPITEMRGDQKHLAHAFLNSVLSKSGYQKAMTIMMMEQVLHVLENNAPHRNPELYYFCFFDKPSPKGKWGFRVEGHHLSINFTMKDGEVISTTPLFMGANPAKVMQGVHTGLKALKKEEEFARQLIKSFNDEQRSQALISTDAPADVLTGAKQVADPLEEKGLPVSKMNPEQSKQLFNLIKEYVYRVRPVFAERDLKEIEQAGPAKIQFAWMGGIEEGDPHYYRIQGPTFVLEYDNTQNDANHVHTVWRDFKGDFGMDILRMHYQAEHQN